MMELHSAVPVLGVRLLVEPSDAPAALLLNLIFCYWSCGHKREKSSLVSLGPG